MNSTIEIHNQTMFWIGTAALGIGAGMTLAAIGFRALITAVTGIVLVFTGTVLLLLGG